MSNFGLGFLYSQDRGPKKEGSKEITRDTSAVQYSTRPQVLELGDTLSGSAMHWWHAQPVTSETLHRAPKPSRTRGPEEVYIYGMGDACALIKSPGLITFMKRIDS